MSTQNLTAQTFEPTVAAGGIVLVDFWGAALEQVVAGIRGLDMDEVRGRRALRTQPA